MAPAPQHSKDKKHKIAELKLLKIINKINSSHLSQSYLSNIELRGKSESHATKYMYFENRGRWSSILMATFLFLYWIYTGMSSESCSLELPSISKAVFRPPEHCSMCVDVKGVARVANISSHEFERKYAYSTQPVIVTDAANSWKAMKEFNFNFFKKFYETEDFGTKINECFFFPYKSGFRSMSEVFGMDTARANLTGEPWYVGWSTCYDQEVRRLRSYYDHPYFLPKTAESDIVDWIFMGGPGQGAHMHVDSVRRSSWQAQVRGAKRWSLAPPPECYYACDWLAFTVHPGEILVVDTNRWYHSTRVLPGDLSITIGAEYD